MRDLARDQDLRALWWGAVGGLLAWSAHLLAGYLLITGGCPVLPGAALTAAFLALTVALAAAAASALAAALLTARGVGWRAFAGRAGALLDALALATIVLGGTQVLILPPCA